MKHTKEVFVHLHKYDDGEFYLAEGDMSKFGYVLVNKQMIDFHIPNDFDPVPVKMAMLQAQEAKVREEFNERIAQIKDEISKLQALTYEGTT